MSDSAPVETAGSHTRLVRVLRGGEELVANLALAAMVVLPLAEIVVRPVFSGGIPGSISFVQHLTLCVGFLGAALAAREGKLIALATATFLPAGGT
ncbi:MAG: TRAP transporter small permease subunit, partial [Vicinamibacterales bacterium]|nr:TRAP transporter small permease subunit [Vicinamibacterales bacterium]